MTVAVVSFISFIIAGFVQNWMIALPVGVVLMLAVLILLRFITKSGKLAGKVEK